MSFWPNRQPLPTDESFRGTFPQAVGALSLESLIEADQANVPKSIGRYGLVPILRSQERHPGTGDYLGSRWHVAGSDVEELTLGYVHVDEPDTDAYPYLDAAFAAGLTYRSPRAKPPETRLCALVSADVERPGELSIKQIQAMWTRPERRKSDSGLWGGFNWKRVLVRGLVDIAADSGFKTVKILGAESQAGRFYGNDRRRRHYIETYDQVADDLGFRHRKPDWELKLSRYRERSR